MKPLYDRLKSHGLDRKYIHAAVLPDWWEDNLSGNESNRLMAELSIARFLGVSVKKLRDPEAGELALAHEVRLKRNRNAEVAEVTGAVAAASHAARMTAKLLEERLPFTGRRPALEIRNQLLARPECTWPDLGNLVSYCWEHGIAVVHVTALPRQSKSIDGLATFVGERPVIVLTSKRDGPAWLAFHLAHEIGHIMCGHVKPGDSPLVDIKLESANDEDQEREADEYAFQILTGWPNPQFGGPGMRAAALAQAAYEFGEQHRIHPGTVALIYGYSKNRIPVAQSALKVMDEDSGAREILAEAFRKHVPLDDLPDAFQRSLSAMTQIFGQPQVAD